MAGTEKILEAPEDLKPDWDYWWRVEVTTLHQAVVLSCGWEAKGDSEKPRYETRYFAAISPNKELIEERIFAAIAALGQRNGLVEEKNSDPNVPDDTPSVNLRSFGMWARRRGWKIPSEFPCEFSYPSKNVPDGVLIEFPYRCQAISALTEMAHEHFLALDPDNPPKQANFALKIADRFKIKLRIAITVAKLFKPDVQL